MGGNIGAFIITYTSSGVPYYSYSPSIVNRKTLLELLRPLQYWDLHGG